MNLSLTSVFPAPDRHTGIACAEMTVIIRSEEDIQDDVALRYGPKESTHQAKNSSDSVIGSMYAPSL